MRPRKTLPNRQDEIKKAKESKEYFKKLVNFGSNDLVILKCGKFDKYGRLLTTVYKSEDIDEIKNLESINDEMINSSNGTPYFGGKKK